MVRSRTQPEIVERVLCRIEAEQNRPMRRDYLPPVWRTKFNRRQWLGLLDYSGVDGHEKPAAAAWFLWLSFDALFEVGRHEQWERPDDAPPADGVERREEWLCKMRDALVTIQDGLDTVAEMLPSYDAAPSNFAAPPLRLLSGLRNSEVVPPSYRDDFVTYGGALARAHRQREEDRRSIGLSIYNGKHTNTLNEVLDSSLEATVSMLARLPEAKNQGGRPSVEHRHAVAFELASIFDIYHPHRRNDGELKRFVQSALTLAIGAQQDGAPVVSEKRVGEYLRAEFNKRPSVRAAAWHKIWLADELGLGYLGDGPDIPLPWRR